MSTREQLQHFYRQCSFKILYVTALSEGEGSRAPVSRGATEGAGVVQSGEEEAEVGTLSLSTTT